LYSFWVLLRVSSAWVNSLAIPFSFFTIYMIILTKCIDFSASVE
jgi:hypothetical protein